ASGGFRGRAGQGRAAAAPGGRRAHGHAAGRGGILAAVRAQPRRPGPRLRHPRPRHQSRDRVDRGRQQPPRCPDGRQPAVVPAPAPRRKGDLLGGAAALRQPRGGAGQRRAARLPA
nr:hypothetical protein [Tanacetum cinerariifolium]